MGTLSFDLEPGVRVLLSEELEKRISYRYGFIGIPGSGGEKIPKDRPCKIVFGSGYFIYCTKNDFCL